MVKKLMIVTRALIGASILQVLAVRFKKPLLTPLMLIRWTTSAFSDDHPIPIQY